MNFEDDGVMKSDAKSVVFAGNMVKDLSKHVQFEDSEQDAVDKF